MSCLEHSWAGTRGPRRCATCRTHLSCCYAGNVLLTSCDDVPHGFHAKISDFGLARTLNVQSKIETRTYGTITHMPLELLCDGIMSKVRRRCPELAHHSG